jgi:maltose-binding protein MalE
MQITRLFARTSAAIVAVALAIVLTAASTFAASGFVGKWKTTDTEGKAFTIWLSDDGKAKGDRGTEGLAGMWKEDGGAAVITWDSGWVTKITKEGNSYQKTALKDGKPVGKAAPIEKLE